MACNRFWNLDSGFWVRGAGRAKAFRVMVGMALSAMPAVGGGCARVLSITQDEAINTAMQQHRDKGDRTGEPLELNIVCVTPGDLGKDANEELKPTSDITSTVWFAKRPVSADAKDNKGKFLLPRSQIYLLSNDTNAFGVHKGPALRGSKVDGEKVVTEGDIAFPFGALHDDKAVIYVFGKFVADDGSVLPVKPATFCPPGAYTSELSIHIGVDQARYGQGGDNGQFIRITAERKMHGKGRE